MSELKPTTTSSGFVAHVLSAIESAPIIQEPYPHIYIDGIFPDDFYADLLARIDSKVQFEKAIYPGTSVDMKADGFKDYGLIASDVESDEIVHELYQFLRSETFTRTLLNKFSAPGSRGQDGTAIPEEKHAHFKGNDDFTPVFDLHLDLPGYEIPPHPDNPNKIVTFLFYMAKDRSLAKYGTNMCAPKPGVVPQKPSVSMMERALSVFSGKFGLAQRAEWYRWEDFDIVKTAEAVPNTLLCFAPNEISYHAVRVNAPETLESKGRPIIRGFIRTGSSKSNYLASHKDGMGRKLALGLARIFNRADAGQ